jgi:hypothetical protein
MKRIAAFVTVLLLLLTMYVVAYGKKKHKPNATSLGGNIPYPVTPRTDPTSATKCYADLDTVVLRLSATVTDQIEWCSDSTDSYTVVSISPSNPFPTLTLPLSIPANSCKGGFAPNTGGGTTYTYVLKRNSDGAQCDPNIVIK